MADVSGIRTDWENVSYNDWLQNNARAQANRINAPALNVIGTGIRNVNTHVESLATLFNEFINNPPSGGLEPGQDVHLPDSATHFLHIHVPDDGTPTNSWPDRLAFFFEDGSPGGRRSGYFNEYGELRARPARTSTVGFRAMSHNGASVEHEFFQVSVEANSPMLGVNKEYINLHAPLRHAPSDSPLANVIVLDNGESVPIGTPEGTVVVIRPL